jgi:hypothetical protein
MILIQISNETANNFSFWGGSIPDWLEALGGVAAVIGLLTLFRRDKNKEDQIASLTKLAVEAQKQSGQLFSHTLILQEQTKHMQSELDLLKASFEEDKRYYEARINSLLSQERANKAKNMPFFSGENYRVDILSERLMSFSLLNRGESAKNFSVSDYDRSQYNFDIKSNNFEINKGSFFLLVLKAAVLTLKEKVKL